MANITENLSTFSYKKTSRDFKEDMKIPGAARELGSVDPAGSQGWPWPSWMS